MVEPGKPLPMLPAPIGHAGPTSPCVAHACRDCCFDTQMPLTEDDMARLESVTKRPRTAFTVTGAGPPRLRNEDGHCVFLGAAGCTVYNDRPAGCRLYPLVMDPDTEKGVLDTDCPYSREYRLRPRDRAALAELVDHLELLS